MKTLNEELQELHEAFDEFKAAVKTQFKKDGWVLILLWFVVVIIYLIDEVLKHIHDETK